jgi:hypothetical protein
LLIGRFHSEIEHGSYEETIQKHQKIKVSEEIF